MSRKVENLYNEVCQWKDRTLSDNVKDRLSKSLELYLSELNAASERIQGKKVRTVYKELIR